MKPGLNGVPSGASAIARGPLKVHCAAGISTGGSPWRARTVSRARACSSVAAS